MSSSPASAAKKSAATEPLQAEGWQRELSHAVRSTAELRQRLLLPAEVGSTDTADFPVLVPESFLRRMQPGNPLDPLLLQVLPQSAERESPPGFVADPVGDRAARRSPGLLHKYHGRALLITTSACAVHCRYCFRRAYPYTDEPRRADDWNPALQAIAEDNSIREIILSGGDPLSLSDRRLEELILRLDAIPHLDRIRIHSRWPIVLPSRVTGRLLSALNELRSQPIFVVHANHPQEIAADCADALRLLVHSGMPVLNQAVLLRGINDSPEILEQLCLSLINLGVMPYYLHQLDRVAGAAHFEVAESVGVQLEAELRRRLPGYAVPQYVREIAGAESKLPVS
ncbi:MAG: EF-P beta-lysylation protein EpmB [Planctomycetaceae bacterium]